MQNYGSSYVKRLLSRGSNSKELFKGLKIENDKSYLTHLNKHNVISNDMSRMYLKHKDELIQNLNTIIVDDLNDSFPNILKKTDNAIDDAILRINEVTDERFIFLIDEWDVVFREAEYNQKLCNEYIEFLRALFKSSDVSSCIDLVFMTCILPIRRYSNKQTLKMFKE